MWHRIAALDALKPEQMKRIQVQGRPLLLCRGQSGTYYVIDEYCSHEDYSLYFGCVQGEKIKCSLHGSYFDLKTGHALNEPAEEALNTYSIKIESNNIWLKIN